MSESWENFTVLQRIYIRWTSLLKAHYDSIVRNNWGATMNYAVLASFNRKYLKGAAKYYHKARSVMLKNLKDPDGHLVISKVGFSNTCCRDMHDAIIFREVDLNYDYEKMFSSIRVDSIETGTIERTDRCPYCGAKIEGITVDLSE